MQGRLMLFLVFMLLGSMTRAQTLDLREICHLNYKTDFSSLLERAKDDLFPKSSTVGAVHFYRGLSLLRQAQYLEAIRDFKTARTDTTVDRSFCNFYIGIAYMQLNWTDSILSICSEALNVPPADLIKPEFWQNAPFDTNSRDYVFSSYLLGTNEVLYKPGDTALIDALYTYSIKDTTFFEPYFNYGTYCYNLQRFKKSIYLFIKARKLNENEDTTILSCLGYMYRLSGDPEQSLKSYDLLIGQYPGFAIGFNNRGCIQAYKEKYGAAMKDFRIVSKLDRNMQEAYFNLGVVFLRTGRYRKAIDAMTSAIELRPEDADAYYYRGFAGKNSGDLPGSVADFTQAIELKK